MSDEIKALIKRRRAQMIIHSYIYYELNENLISDDQWQAWAEELHKLQTDNPKLCKIRYYDKEFSDWDGTTGNHLPKTIIVETRAKQILENSKNYDYSEDN
jgi:NAD-dependent DNA ligase